MEHFTNNFTLVQGLTISFSIAAIIISFIGFRFSKRNARRQLRIGKLEEIIESVLMILDNYSALKFIFDLEQKIRNPKIERTGLETMSWQSDKENYVLGFRKTTDVNKFREKLTRLSVLANSYLPNKRNGVKYMILSVVDLTANLCQATIVDDFDCAIENYPKFPEPDFFFNYVEEIEKLVIEEMGLGYKSLEMKKVIEYKEKFKKALLID